MTPHPLMECKFSFILHFFYLDGFPYCNFVVSEKLIFIEWLYSPVINLGQMVTIGHHGSSQTRQSFSDFLAITWNGIQIEKVRLPVTCRIVVPCQCCGPDWPGEWCRFSRIDSSKTFSDDSLIARPSCSGLAVTSRHQKKSPTFHILSFFCKRRW